MCVSHPPFFLHLPPSLCAMSYLFLPPSQSISCVDPNHQMIAACPQICATVCALQVISGSNVASLIKLTTLLSCKFLSCQTPLPPPPHPQPRRTPPPPNTLTHFSHFMVTSFKLFVCVCRLHFLCGCQLPVVDSFLTLTLHPPPPPL